MGRERDGETTVDLLEGLSDEQRAVAEHDRGVALVCAVAGAGKTTTMCRRIARLMQRGADGDRILAVTSTKAGASAMNDKLEALGVRLRKARGDGGVRVGTFHSLCLEIIRDGSPWKGYEVDDSDRLHYCLKDILGYRGMNWSECDLTDVAGFIGWAKNEAGVTAAGRVDAGVLAEMHARFPRWRDPRYSIALEKLEAERHKRRLLSFDDMLSTAVLHLDADAGARARWESRYQHVMVDEFQDTNRAQMRLVDHLVAGAESFMAIGDDDQCQPPDTVIQLPGGSKALGDIMVGDRVRVYQEHSGKVVGDRKVLRAARRQYDGMLYSVVIEQRSLKNISMTNATPNHRIPVRWSNNHDTNLWCNYLMRKGAWYRTGWCQVFNSEGAFHLGQRARLEGADAAWILSVHRSKEAAAKAEQMTSVRYGIPLPCFVSQPTHTLKQSTLDELFHFASNHHRIKECFKDHKLDISFPLWPFPSKTAGANFGRSGGSGSKTFQCYIPNIIPGLMSVHAADVGWVPVAATDCRLYSGEVVSLEVQEHHNYVADGVVVSNCIYEWRGSKTEYTTKFEDFHPGSRLYFMQANYRSRPEVLAPANRAIAVNVKRIAKSNAAQREAGGLVEVSSCANSDDEANHVAAQIRDGVAGGRAYRDHAVLYRTNALSRALEEAFIREKIPHVVVGGTSFYDRKEVADLLAYLRLAHDPMDDAAFVRAVNRPFRYIGKQSVEKLLDAGKKEPEGPLGACSNPPRWAGLQYRQERSVREFAGIVRGLRDAMNPGPGFEAAKPDALLSKVLDETDYLAWLARDEGTDTAENSRVSNVKELVRTAGRFATVAALLEYVDSLKAARKAKPDEEGEDKRDVVLLMTIHKAKGLEWPVVFLAGCSQGILPHARAEDVEEERRLFYVAVTRAREECRISSPIRFGVGGEGAVKDLPPSQFIGEAGLALVSHASAPGVVDAARLTEALTVAPIGQAGELAERLAAVEPLLVSAGGEMAEESRQAGLDALADEASVFQSPLRTLEAALGPQDGDEELLLHPTHGAVRWTEDGRLVPDDGGDDY